MFFLFFRFIFKKDLKYFHLILLFMSMEINKHLIHFQVPKPERMLEY